MKKPVIIGIDDEPALIAQLHENESRLTQFLERRSSNRG